MIITKKPERRGCYNSKILYYESARKALEDIFINLTQRENTTVLLPAFIGYSPKEGSGIFDPVRKTGIGFEFYEMTENLLLDVDDIKRKIDFLDTKVAIMLVHYWGYIDPNYEKVAEICRARNVVIIEDAAHGLFTEVYGKTMAGKYADYVIYSLHKMFPMDNGGALRILNGSEHIAKCQEKVDFDIFEYDIWSICEKRISNGKFLENMLKDNPKVKILRPEHEYKGNVPQTFPVLLDKSINRYDVYLELNNMGYGVVSLYHTLIKEISPKKFYSSGILASGILNLPVHQDVSDGELESLCQNLKKILSCNE